MTLQNGGRLGPYEITGPLGAGGMGEVYRARDTRLNRNVAIKVLPAALAGDAGFSARLDREARAISQLNHPNICTLYDVGHDSGTDYLVMELIDGETLADRIGRAPLLLTDVLRFGVQIADALAAAHRVGIVHRDLKPGNVMITKSGAKLLDFGLAKLMEPPSDPAMDPLAATARHDPLTMRGVVVGTVPYMSPEQLQGKVLDPRTDIFSFGTILYEMTTGQRPFPGGSSEVVIAAILSSEPTAIHSLQPGAPAALTQIIATALEKDPEQRWQTAQDVARQLRWIGEGPQAARPFSAPSSGKLARFAPIAVAAGVTALLTWGATRHFSPAAAIGSSLQLEMAPSDLQLPDVGENTHFAISPDGQTVCFAAGKEGPPSLFLRRLDSPEVRKIEGSNGANGVFWSSDGSSVGFSAQGKLWKTKVSGGAPEAICDLMGSAAVASWQGGTILFSDRPGGRRELFRVSDQGGIPEKVTTAEPGEWRHTWPVLLADGQHYLYQSYAANSIDRRLILASFESPKKTVLLRNVSRAATMGDDQLLYVRDGTLLTQRLDMKKGRTTSDPKTIASNVSYFYPTAGSDFAGSSNGVVIYRTQTSRGLLVLRDRKGAEIRVLDRAGPFLGDHALSPDGKKAAVTVTTRATGLSDIWIYDLIRGVRDRFTSEPGMEVFPVWSPDGRSLVYSSAQGGAVPHLVRHSLSGSPPEEIAPRGPFQIARSFSPDGRFLYYADGNSPARLNVKTRVSERVFSATTTGDQPEVSPDGKTVAYVSSASGPPEIYVQDLSEGADRIRISDGGGGNPSWRRDGQELFYVGGDGRSVMSATPRSPRQWNDPVLTQLFRVPATIVGMRALPDGQSFLISDVTPGAGDSLFHVIAGLK